MSGFRHVARSATYYRVAHPTWADPLDGLPAMPDGGRWNRPGSFPVVYLNQTIALARRFVAHKLRGQPYGPEDLEPDAGPDLAHAEVPSDDYVDIVSDAGCRAAGLPTSYPVSPTGEPVAHEDCRPLGDRAWNLGERGIACRSATFGASRSDEELAWSRRDTTMVLLDRQPFATWFF